MALGYYDPNEFNLHQSAKQIVELTVQQWQYKKVVHYESSGNAMGMDLIDHAIYSTYEGLPVDDRKDSYIILTDEAGNTLECTDEDFRGEDWLKEMIVKSEIIAVEPVIDRRSSKWCYAMDRMKSECGCPDCGSSLLG